jgi:UTP--glucose-1-phosphate uridylyltransferase
MHIRKAVITAAAPNQNTLPLQRLVDKDGEDKTALQLIVEEVSSAGVEEICVVIQPGDAHAYEMAAGKHLGSLSFVEQLAPLGYGDALCRAKAFVGNEPFLHLVGDHLYISAIATPCARQLIQVANEHGCAVSAVQATRENKLAYFGVIGGTPVSQHRGLYEVHRVVEKPTPTLAEQALVTPGLRLGHYLCFFGMHVLTPAAIEILEGLLQPHSPSQAKISLSEALGELAKRERYLALQIQGARYNIGIKYGLLMTQLALALSGRDRDPILTEMLEMLANRAEVSTPR